MAGVSQSPPPVSQISATLTAIMTIASAFAAGAIARSQCQARSGGPSRRC